VVPDDVGPRIRQLREQLDKLQARKEELDTLVAERSAQVPTQGEIAECVVDLRAILERGTLPETKAFVRSFIREISVIRDEAKLIYIMPTSNQDAMEPVLAIERYGGQ
ncbi:MAG: hypothetical protein Q7T04_06630, partial [Dehalococcoidia bacterium]|nr:hypothetical protein [Dehalococcoidia bacterium]